MSTAPMPDDECVMSARDVIALPAYGGRRYAMGKLTALFKADAAETASRYCVSEWILEPGQEGVGAHIHDANDEIFYVLEGSPEILLGDTWRTFQAGAFIRVPAMLTHDFRNHGSEIARLLNVFIPGGFERDMPKIVAWFSEE